MEIETVTNGSAGNEAPAQETSAPAVATGNNAQGGEKSATDQRGNQPNPQESAATERHKIKYGKSERELSIEELKMFAQKGWAADDRFQQAAKMKRELEGLVKGAKWGDLIERQTGKSAIEFYKDQLKAELRRQAMTPQEREEAETKDRLSKLRAEEQEIKTARQEERVSQMEKHYAEQWDKELAQAVESEGLPKNRYAIGRAVQIAKKVVDMGLDPDWGLVVKEAKAQIQDDLKQLFAAYKDDNALLSFIGDEFGLRVSKALVNRKNPPQSPKVKAVEAAGTDSFRSKSTKPVDMDSWFEARRKKFEEG